MWATRQLWGNMLKCWRVVRTWYEFGSSESGT
jgi:hypothetical protein